MLLQPHGANPRLVLIQELPGYQSGADRSQVGWSRRSRERLGRLPKLGSRGTLGSPLDAS